jgi:type III restriction enzyme
VTTFKNEDLVLTPRADYNPALLNLDAYEAFLDALCGDREYQKESIRSVCRFLAGGEYTSIQELAAECYGNNRTLEERYGSLSGLVEALPFPEKLACSVDLATGTGKSFVMYGIARILLSEGVVDRVLVLCPSLTIEAELRNKFRQLSADSRLLDLIPETAGFRTPEITTANVTTGPGCICVENIAATYEHVRSSVRDSFEGMGASTLVLNDEAHHIYSPIAQADASVKKWKEFLDDEAYGFQRIAGFSGTCYRGNDYFADVISRYSLRQAMDEGRVKAVHYVQKDESLDENERFQKYLQLHKENQRRYPELKPVSIIVTSKIAAAEGLADKFRKFLVDQGEVDADGAEKLVLIVTSKPAHKEDVHRLATIDDRENPAEWVISVSMLTEGWDVQNVFQVVPHEKRAFDSKLLIAQVLGRGLRVPCGVSKPVLRVFNHARWSTEIANLVREVLEDERRLYSYAVTHGEHSKAHFELHQLRYETETTTKDLPRKDPDENVKLFTKEIVQLETQFEAVERQTVFVSATDNSQSVLRTKVRQGEYPVDEVVQNMWGKLKAVDLEAGTSYSREYSREVLRGVVERSLENIGETRGVVTEPNMQRLLRAMGTIRREMARTVRIERKPLDLESVSTRDLPMRSAGLSNFEKEATVFYDSESLELSEDGDSACLKELADDESSYPRRATREISNKYFFKSPVNVVLTTHEPERSFVARLFQPEVAEKLVAWIKSTDTGFYPIDYSWRRGEHTKQGRFNPDLFIKLKREGAVQHILVVELKGDTDASDENRAKLRFAKDHFDRINGMQDSVRYHMFFVSPASYDLFFGAINDGSVLEFVSGLQASLS